MEPTGTLLLTRKDVASLLTIEDCTAAVEQAFKMHGEGKTMPPGVLGVHARDGGFHIKAGILELNRSYFAAKINANFPKNPKQLGLPLIQGVIVLSDAANGYPLAVMDSIEITIQRTGGATAVAAKYLARPDSRTITICGCGNQGAVSVRAVSKIFSIEKVFAFDLHREKADKFAAEVSTEFGVDAEAVTTLARAVRQSDIVVTCTPSKEALLKLEWIGPGTFIAAVGADNEEKQELEPELLAKNKTVVDLIEQASTIGELHHALDSRVMTKDDVHAELGEVLAGHKRGRISADEVTIFDSTGMALQDVIVAAAVYEKAIAEKLGQTIDFGSHSAKANAA